MTDGPNYSYCRKPSNAFHTVKQHKEYARKVFAGSNIKITTEGARHLGAILGNIGFKEEYLRNVIQA